MTKPAADFDRVPVIDIHKENFAKYKDEMYSAMEDCSFVAIDCVSYKHTFDNSE